MGIINKRTREFLRELSFSFKDHTFQIGEVPLRKTGGTSEAFGRDFLQADASGVSPRQAEEGAKNELRCNS